MGVAVAREVTVHTDPIAFLAKLGQLPEEQQETILRGAGKILMDKDPAITCNIFGGVDSCQQLPADSEFGTACGKERDDLRVDCIFYRDAEKSMKLDPSGSLADALGDDYAKLKGHCPQCLDNMQALWCVQVLPECGSFEKSVHSAIFPAIEKIKQKEDEGEAKSVAIAAAVPTLVKAFANTLGCREMCQAVVDTCSCSAQGDSMSFGDALESAKMNMDMLQKFHPGLTVADLKTTVFKDMWDVPVCQVFTPKDDDAFIGECDMSAVNAQCSDGGFCAGLDDGKKALVEAVIATQMARTILGFTHGASGLAGQHSAIGQVAPASLPALPSSPPASPAPPLFPDSTPSKPDDPFRQSTEADAATKARTAGHTGAATSESGDEVQADVATSRARSGVGTFFLSALMATVLGAAGYFAFKWRQEQQRRHVFRGNYEALEEDGIPLT